MPSATTLPEPLGACPGCGAAATATHAPFCGQGCRDRDLLRWLSDGYRIPGPPADPLSDSGAPDGLDSATRQSL